MSKFSEKLRALRQRKGYTLGELGEILGVHHTHVSQLETNRKIPSAAMILKIADIFGVSTDQLMRDELDLEDSEFNYDQTSP
jgi:transcriptional regulator with XRE-family HTH domain